MLKSKKILIISHDAIRTGAPILLLNLVKLLLSFNELEIHFLLKYGGELEDDFKKMALTHFLFRSKKTRFHFIKKRLFKDKSLIENKQFLNQYHSIISNTITNGDILGEIRANYNGQIISYIHELEVACKTFTTPSAINVVLNSSDRFWVPSNLVKEFLNREYTIPESRIIAMPYYIENKTILGNKNKDVDKCFVIGGCGTIDWRKGPDLFLQVAIELFLKSPYASIMFKWRGADKPQELMRLEYQVKMARLTGRVIFETASDNLDSFYQEIDLFLLTSREDPYPLVILEAAKHSIPSICFDSVCGSKDFIVKSRGGNVVPFLDIPAVVDSILAYYNNPNYLKENGNNAKNYLIQTHSNKQYVYNEFMKAIL